MTDELINKLLDKLEQMSFLIGQMWSAIHVISIEYPLYEPVVKEISKKIDKLFYENEE